MGIAVILPGQVMLVLVFAVRGQLLDPREKILVQSVLVIVDENARCDVHGVHEAQPLVHAAFPDRFFDPGREMHDLITLFRIYRKIFGMGLHGQTLLETWILSQNAGRKSRRLF
jgi:hypothetical protein